jgi:hypothetical protein
MGRTKYNIEGRGALGKQVGMGKERDIASFFRPKVNELPKKRGRGRPRKKKKVPPPVPVEQQPAEKPKAQEPHQKKQYMKYDSPGTKTVLDAAVDFYISTGKYPSYTDLEMSPAEYIPIPKSTIYTYAKRRQSSESGARPQVAPRLNSGNSLADSERPGRGCRSLTTKAMRSFLANTAKFRDEAQNGMTRKELVQLMLQVTGSSSMEQCYNHYGYLVRKKLLPELKNHGRVRIAQATTTKRACLRTEQQLRWHNLVTTIWEEHRRVNQPSQEFLRLQDHFMINLDESNIQGSNGVLRVVGSAIVKKHEKTTQDCRESVTMIRIGSAAGTQGPWIFLVKGKKELDKNSALRNLRASFPMAPPFSKVFVTPNAYLTDDCWREITPYIAKGIRAMPVIRDYPDWWVCMTLDGYKSHLLPEALEPFTELKIEVSKEEGDTSQSNQAYDQEAAKEDKRLTNEALDMCRGTRSHQVLNRETIVAACIHALSKVKAETWRSSFIKVNLHPHHRVEFAEWCKRNEQKLAAGDRFFKNRVGLFDAMPAFWKNMPGEHRHAVVALIDRFHEEAKKNSEGKEEQETPWKTENIHQLVKYVALDKIQQLRGCYHTTKLDPSVLCEPDRTAEKAAEAAEAKKQNESLLCNYNFTWKPKVHSDAIAAETERSTKGTLIKPASKKTRDAYFDHLCNFVSRQHGAKAKEGEHLVPSSYLHLELKKQQRKYLNPTPSDVIVGNIMEDAIGDNAKKKIAKRRINFLNGNVESYSRSLNNPKQLEYIKDANNLSACLAAIEEGKLLEKEDAKKRKAVEQKQKKAKKAKKSDAFKKKKEELYEGLKADVHKGLEHICKLSKPRLEQLAKYYFLDKTPNRSKMKAKQLLELVERCFQSIQQTQQEA